MRDPETCVLRHTVGLWHIWKVHIDVLERFRISAIAVVEKQLEQVMRSSLIGGIQGHHIFYGLWKESH